MKKVNLISFLFYFSAEDFYSTFGDVGLKRLVLICILDGEMTSDIEKFRLALHNSDGYKFLKLKNNNVDVPFVIWNNFNPYPNQVNKLKTYLEGMDKIDKASFNLIFENIENQIESINQLRETESKYFENCSIM